MVPLNQNSKHPHLCYLIFCLIKFLILFVYNSDCESFERHLKWNVLLLIFCGQRNSLLNIFSTESSPCNWRETWQTQMHLHVWFLIINADCGFLPSVTAQWHPPSNYHFLRSHPLFHGITALHCCQQSYIKFKPSPRESRRKPPKSSSSSTFWQRAGFKENWKFDDTAKRLTESGRK